MEWACNDSLGSLLDSYRWGQVTLFRSPTRKASIICDIVMGMRHAHGHGVIHRDLKPCNILLDENWRAKIGDFGLSRPESAEDPMTGDTGTVGYAAPEQLYEDGELTTKTDVFAFGLILYEIITGERVFGEYEPLMTIVKRLRRRQFPAVPEEFGSLMQSLIVRCWAADQRERPSCDAILNEFQEADFRILEAVDAEYLRKSVDDVLQWESEQRLRRTEYLRNRP